MIKFDMKKSKTVTIIVTSLVIGLIVLLPMTVLPNVNASSLTKDCIRKMTIAMHSKASSLDNEKAIALASTSPEFKSKILDNKSRFVSIFNTWNLDKVNCGVIWRDVNIAYLVTDANGNMKTSIVTLDPTLSKIIGVKMYAPIWYTDYVASNWSGYEFGSSGNSVTETYLNTTIPQISKPTTSNYGCVSTTGETPGCDLAVWTGLVDISGGRDHRIAQAGSDSNLTCNNTSCTAPTYHYFIWYEMVPNSSIPCLNANITSNDPITVDVALIRTVGSTGYYNLSAMDTRANVACSNTNVSSNMTNPSLAPFIDERANSTEGYHELANFTSNTFNGQIALNNGSLGSITSSEIQNSYTMENPSPPR
jgi:hypothetical protein